MNNDTIRIVRVLEYVGPETELRRALSQNAVKGIQTWGNIQCREATLGQGFPEVVDEKPKAPDLGKIGGYFEDGSAEGFSLYTDDATRTWYVIAKDGTRVAWGSTIEPALKNTVVAKDD